MKKLKIFETTWSGMGDVPHESYPDDGSGISGDDDRPPGNILIGSKFRELPFFNKLTNFTRNWEPDPDKWKWDHFEMAQGMEDYDNYSQSLQAMASIFPEKTWEKVWMRMSQVGDKETDKSFDKAGQPHRTAKTGQIGKDDVVVALPPEEIQTRNKNDIVSKIDTLTM